ncbi:hypothetical protein B0H16DRAFT_1456122 [Mycena metata]|uniref:Uncharacterized protein n=1 Tax=Mycena metata TaxID=1033252 RepID=A0AAD7JE13_9AGAR|nr:hypothetical protein B0H16DRAFT_1456122 [Mycena metata]
MPVQGHSPSFLPLPPLVVARIRRVPGVSSIEGCGGHTGLFLWSIFCGSSSRSASETGEKTSGDSRAATRAKRRRWSVEEGESRRRARAKSEQEVKKKHVVGAAEKKGVVAHYVINAAKQKWANGAHSQIIGKRNLKGKAQHGVKSGWKFNVRREGGQTGSDASMRRLEYAFAFSSRRWRARPFDLSTQAQFDMPAGARIVACGMSFGTPDSHLMLNRPQENKAS